LFFPPLQHAHISGVTCKGGVLIYYPGECLFIAFSLLPLWLREPHLDQFVFGVLPLTKFLAPCPNFLKMRAGRSIVFFGVCVISFLLWSSSSLISPQTRTWAETCSLKSIKICWDWNGPTWITTIALFRCRCIGVQYSRWTPALSISKLSGWFNSERVAPF